MPQAEITQDHLSDYERAVCYYTLPRLANPVSLGIIMVYAFCLFEALCLIAYGTYADIKNYVYAGVIAFAGLVLFGVLVFLFRALLNDVRKRKALAQARGVPDARDTSLPDPFANHVLLKHPINQQGKLFACTEDDLSIAYFVDSTPEQNWWKISDLQGQEICRVKAVGRIGSFMFDVNLPRPLDILLGDSCVAKIKPKFSLTAPTIHIVRENAVPSSYLIRSQGIYAGSALVGRVYTLRTSLYLDIQREHLNEATLAYFISLN